MGSGTGASNPGGGAPDTTGDDIPDACTLTNCGPVDTQSAAAMAAMMADAAEAKRLRDQGLALIIAGYVCYAAGLCLLWWPATPVGVILIAIGLVLIGIGIYQTEMSYDKEEEAYKKADAEYARTTNKDQYVRNKYCIAKAIEGETCNPTEQEIRDMVEQLEKNEAAVKKAREEAAANENG